MKVIWSLAGALAFARVIIVRARGLSCILVVFLILSLAGCSGGSPVSGVSVTTETATTAPTSTPLPSDTPTPEPTATLEPTVPPTLTPPPPTDTPVPPLAVEPDGFQAWCAPLEYEGSRPDSLDAPVYARQLTRQNDLYRVPIPAAYCTIAFHFNQPVMEGLEVHVLDGTNPFLKLPLDPAQGQPGAAWTTLTHQYIINPPYWEVTYTLVVLDPGGVELWSSPVTFAKPLPEPCPYGGLPDPVTLYCTKTDPWEIEPWPDVEYPYDRSRLITPGADD